MGTKDGPSGRQGSPEIECIDIIGRRGSLSVDLSTRFVLKYQQLSSAIISKYFNEENNSIRFDSNWNESKS